MPWSVNPFPSLLFQIPALPGGGLLFYGIGAFYIYRKRLMIYLKNTADRQVAFIPKNGEHAAEERVNYPAMLTWNRERTSMYIDAGSYHCRCGIWNLHEWRDLGGTWQIVLSGADLTIYDLTGKIMPDYDMRIYHNYSFYAAQPFDLGFDIAVLQPSQFSLVIKNTIDLTETSVSVESLMSTEIYYNIAVTLPDGLPDGEYEYHLSMGNELLSSGLLILGENFQPSQLQREIAYTQYESE